jgi:hypothetical protein
MVGFVIYPKRHLQKLINKGEYIEAIEYAKSIESKFKDDYDFFAVDENLNPLRSIAQEEGRTFLYSPSGQSLVDIIVQEEPGIARYVVWVYGLSPEGIVPSTPDDYLVIEVPIFPGKESTDPTPIPDPTPISIPEWIKNNAGWWADGSIFNSLSKKEL